MWEDRDGLERDALRSALDDRLRALAVHDVSTERAARIRERCLATLAGRARRRPSALALVAAWWRSVEPAAALAACAVYLLAAAQASTALMRAVR